ncbi:MAG: hypothetical protein KGI71_02085 [Patescibacteria group bacterium]|nr:hypothetical protein [Patescibacteria group bacterium]
MRHHTFFIEASAEEGIAAARAWAERELGAKAHRDPDITVLQYGFFSVEDARRVSEIAAGTALASEHRVIIIAADSMYYEAQNALLKLFEEPPEGMHLFLILPTAGGLLPTLISRVAVLASNERPTKSSISEKAMEFLKAKGEKRSALIKKLANGKDDQNRRESRDEAIQIVNGIEAVAYEALQARSDDRGIVALLSDIAVLRGYLHDRSAPVRMILEHLSLVTPKDLL